MSGGPRDSVTIIPRVAQAHRCGESGLVAKDDSKLEGLSDEELLRLHRRGDPHAFEVLVQRRAGELYRFLSRFLGDRSLADDVLQETFLQVHLSADKFDVGRRFKPWLFTIAANKARDAMRSHSRKRTAQLNAQISETDDESVSYIDLLAADIELPIEELENRELRQSVQKLVMDMPEHLREVLLLGYFQQMPYKDIAEALGVPLGTVKSRLHAAVSYFARRWEPIGKQFKHD
jgi:RNA polymerase sigma-70 factor, ECF subfamily